MNKRIVILALSITALALTASAASAQRLKSPVWNGCIQQFYDREFYGSLSFRNVCSEPVTAVFIPKNPGYGAGEMDLTAGRAESTGYSRSEIIKNHGFDLYVCPFGYQPVDGNDRYIKRAGAPFRCKQN